MTRINITVPNDIIQELRRIKNKSRYIAELLREKFKEEKKRNTERMLIDSYKKAAQEDVKLMKDWDATIIDGIE